VEGNGGWLRPCCLGRKIVSFFADLLNRSDSIVLMYIVTLPGVMNPWERVRLVGRVRR